MKIYNNMYPNKCPNGIIDVKYDTVFITGSHGCGYDCPHNRYCSSTGDVVHCSYDESPVPVPDSVVDISQIL